MIDVIAKLEKSARARLSWIQSFAASFGIVPRPIYGHITLTQTGMDVAMKIYERHTILSRMLTSLGVSPETAAEDACRLEHAISDESFNAIKRYIKTLE